MSVCKDVFICCFNSVPFILCCSIVQYILFGAQLLTPVKDEGDWLQITTDPAARSTQL